MQTETKTPGLVGDRAQYESIVEMPSHYNIDAAVEQVARDLYGADKITGRGHWRRFKPDGANGFSGYLAALSDASGVVGDWRTGQHLVFLVDDDDTTEEREEKRRQARLDRDRERERRDRERQQRQVQAAEKARLWWDHAGAADPCHPYLAAKHVCPHNLRQRGSILLAPLYADGRLVNLQRIWPDGNKRFMVGARIAGAASLIGSITGAGHVYLAEGWATAATIYEASGCPVVVAMNCGNLLPVARSLRAHLPPKVAITIAADNDQHTPGNPGLAHGRHAAELIGADITWPRFPCEDCACSDFNDLAACEGRKEATA